MFRMTSKITVEKIKNEVKPVAIKWKRSITDYSDSATITLPAIAMLKSNDQNTYTRVETGLQFREGLRVEISCGYDGQNTVRFKGFIRRINPKVPLELECEGYVYQLRKKQNVSRSYKAGTTLKSILHDLIDGTDIKLSPSIPDIKIESPVPFKNMKATAVLDYFKEKMLMTVYFNEDVLYVGLREAEKKDTIKLRLGWNVMDGNELKFNKERELATVNISLSQKGKDGKAVYASKADPRNKSVKHMQLPLRVDKATLKKIEDEQRKKMQNRGYDGAISAFLVPYAEPGMAVSIEDQKYPERTGSYFIEAVEGEFGSGGGKQKIKISSTL